MIIWGVVVKAAGNDGVIFTVLEIGIKRAQDGHRSSMQFKIPRYKKLPFHA